MKVGVSDITCYAWMVDTTEWIPILLGPASTEFTSFKIQRFIPGIDSFRCLTADELIKNISIQLDAAESFPLFIMLVCLERRTGCILWNRYMESSPIKTQRIMSGSKCTLWFIFNLLENQVYSSPLFGYWNTLMLCCINNLASRPKILVTLYTGNTVYNRHPENTR